MQVKNRILWKNFSAISVVYQLMICNSQTEHISTMCSVCKWYINLWSRVSQTNIFQWCVLCAGGGRRLWVSNGWQYACRTILCGLYEGCTRTHRYLFCLTILFLTLPGDMTIGDKRSHLFLKVECWLLDSELAHAWLVGHYTVHVNSGLQTAIKTIAKPEYQL